MTNKSLLTLLEPFFKESNFVKERKAFVDYTNPDFYLILEPQKFSFKIERKECFTLNIGIYIPAIYKLIFTEPKDLIAANGIVDSRMDEIIRITTTKRLTNYYVYDDLENLKIDLYQDFRDHIFPFFSQMKTLSDIHDFVETHNLLCNKIGIVPLQRAILKLLLNKEEGKVILKDILDKNLHYKEYYDKIVLIGKTFNIGRHL